MAYSTATVCDAISRQITFGMHHRTPEGRAAIAGLVERRRMSPGDREALIEAAKLIDAEADSWRDGWAVWDGGHWTWPHDSHDEWAHVRFTKLQRAAARLRQLAQP